MKNKIAIYGMGVMGQSLALNIARHHFSVSVFNKEPKATEDFLKRTNGERITACFTIQELINSLEKPRQIILMVTAGEAVDQVIQQLLPLLEAGDILIDGGNSYYKDTIRRCNDLKKRAIYFVGVGISGGEMGALKGPSLMPSGDYQAYLLLEPIFKAIAAKCDDGMACCQYIGPDGSGHYVKMVHNGIEYADIQLICEIYSIMKNAVGLSNDEIQQVFENWNQGELQSYLIEITSKILKVKDERTGNPLIEMILDTAGQKGTGKWTSIEGLDIGVGIPTITESVFARYLSTLKSQRLQASQIYSEKPKVTQNKEKILIHLRKALYMAKTISYAQGFALLKEASFIHNWQLDYGTIALLWRQGCIIRAAFLDDIKKVYEEEKDVQNLLLSRHFSMVLKENSASLRESVLFAIGNGIAVPTLSSTLAYYDGYRSEILPANLLQAQRDYFGAHTYKRIDESLNHSFHTRWEELE